MDKIENDVFSGINNTINEIIWNNIPKDQVLFHYTNCDSLISIIENKEYWLSSIELMNDKEEVDYSLKLVSEVVNGLDLIVDRKKELVENFLKYKKMSAINTFVLSLSMEQDALILWNNYGKNEGYNLGLCLKTLLDDLNNDNVEIVKDSVCQLIHGRVIYEINEQKKILSTLFYAYHKLYRYKQKIGIKNAENDGSVVKIWTTIMLYSSLMKSDLHRIENEFRILLTVPDDSEAIEFRSRNGLILPYIKMRFDNFNSLAKITIGPKIDDKITEETLKYFIEKKIKKEILIETSALKLRF